MTVDTVTMSTAPAATIVVGARTLELKALMLANREIDASGFDVVCLSGVEILRECIRGAPSTTGLVIGYVQSGKTMSMTVLTALAHDNGFPIVVFLAGSKTNLRDQTVSRLGVLRSASRDYFRIWDTSKPLDATRARGMLTRWRSQRQSETYVYAALKHHKHISDMASHLQQLRLTNERVLIIDDEADQASLNTNPASLEDSAEQASTTYRQIAQLRAAAPAHAYIQYTATPQAPLLISIECQLSPRFVKLLRPGVGYIGGEVVFSPENRSKIRSIPEEDLPSKELVEPPASLLDALRAFVVAAAIADLHCLAQVRSMLVHPGKNTRDHRTYETWITEIVKRWRDASIGEHVEDLWEELESTFEDMYGEFEDKRTTDQLRTAVERALDRLAVVVVNSEDANEVNWESDDNFILVGGEKLNRGFTVKGLIVTYMPRGPGGNNADTVQQRARFFGYKERVLPLLRLWLEASVLQSFTDYVDHERDIRRQLEEFDGRPLVEWRRAFFLDDRMKPTRKNVLLNPGRFVGDREWLVLQPRVGNFTALEALAERLLNVSEAGHSQCVTGMREIFDQLLLEFEVANGQAGEWAGMQMILSQLADAGADCSLFRMVRRDGISRREPDSDGAIKVMQGRSASGAKGAYPGDATFFDGDRTTIQLHFFTVGEVQQATICIRLPDAARKTVYVQS